MKTAQVAELKEHLDEVIEAVRHGETVEIRDGDNPLAAITPAMQTDSQQRPEANQERYISPEGIDQTEIYRHLEELIRQGKARRGSGRIPDWFFTETPPKFEGSVLEQLLADRKAGW